MAARRWVPAGSVVLLVLGVLAVRGGSAAAEDDLLGPVGGPEPSAVPSAELPVDAPLLLEADGLDGMRLGSAPAPTISGLTALSGLPDTDGDGRTTSDDLPGGCEPTYGTGGREEQGFSASGWVVDGVVASVQLARWDPGVGVFPGVQTWLGPTLGSPVQSAAELPGARTSVERPHGDPGPAVTVVRVPLDGSELVFSDASYLMAELPEGAQGRITTVELRLPQARACSYEALQALGPAVWGQPKASEVDLTLGPDGVAAFPIGTPVQALRDDPGLDQQLALDGCEAFSASADAGGVVRLVALDGAVVLAQAYGAVPTTLGVAHEGSEADVRAALPQSWETDPGALTDRVEVVVGDRVVTLGLEPGVRWVTDVDVPVQGGPPLVQNISVRDAAADQGRLC